MSEIKVRKALPADANPICLVLDAAFSPFRERYPKAAYEATCVSLEEMRARLDSPDETVLVALDGKTVVGTVSLRVLEGGEMHFYTMAVLPSLQGAGVGKALFDALDKEASERGCTRITLETSAPLARAIRAYEKYGYRRTGKVRPFFGTEVFELVKEL